MSFTWTAFVILLVVATLVWILAAIYGYTRGYERERVSMQSLADQRKKDSGRINLIYLGACGGMALTGLLQLIRGNDPAPIVAAAVLYIAFLCYRIGEDRGANSAHPTWKRAPMRLKLY